MIISIKLNVILLSCLPLAALFVTGRPTKICQLCLLETVGIIHISNDSKKCDKICGRDMELYRIKIYLKIADQMEKEFNPNDFCKKMHICPKYL
uniref:Saposin B-type domain-containing protein n=1 Tax=Wuchereria bancrofti TaxID=6293 RepID=A0AAF5Q4H8_WUCBA